MCLGVLNTVGCNKAEHGVTWLGWLLAAAPRSRRFSRFSGCSLVVEKSTRAVSANSGAVACRPRRTEASWPALLCQRQCKSKLTEAACNSEAPDCRPGPHLLRQ